jgi:hypothetical protein
MDASEDFGRMTRTQAGLIPPFLVLLLALNFAIVGCSVFEVEVEGTAKVASSATLDQSASLTEAASESAAQVSSTPTSTASPSLTPSPTATEPQPAYPDELYAPFVGQGLWFEKYLWAVREGAFISDEPAPVEGVAFWDYSPLTHRLAYGKVSSTVTGGCDLWVYDYSTGKTEQWLESKVIQAQWGPIVDPGLGVQPLAALIDDGMLVVMTAPDKMVSLADQSCCLSWSPTGKYIAVARNNKILSFPIDGSYARTIADEVTLETNITGSRLIWALEHGAMIYPKKPIHIARLDRSEDFLPMTLSGKNPGGKKASTILWSPQTRILVFDEIRDPIQTSEGEIWIYQLSSDLHTVLNEYTFSAENLGLIDWLIPGESVITSHSGVIRVIPATEDVAGKATISAISPNARLLSLTDDLEGFRIITLSDQTKIFNRAGTEVEADALKIGFTIEVIGHPIFIDALLAESIRIQ